MQMLENERCRAHALAARCRCATQLAAALAPYPRWATVAALSNVSGLPPKRIARLATWLRNHAPDGAAAHAVPSFVYFVLNKPRGCVSARAPPPGTETERAGGTVYDCIDERRWPHVPHVGRLDAESEGLLLFSDDGRLAHALLDGSSALAGDASRHVAKVYRVEVRGVRWTERARAWAASSGALGGAPGAGAALVLGLDEVRQRGDARAQLLALAQPLIYCSGQGTARTASARTRCARVRVVDCGDAAASAAQWALRTRAVLEFTLSDGKNRQIRRLCRRSGLTVVSLRRVAMGAWRLGALLPGEARALTTDDVAACYSSLGLDAGGEWQRVPRAIALPLRDVTPALDPAAVAALLEAGSG